MIRRGEYLVRGPAHCAACHTPKDAASAADSGGLPPLSGGRAFRGDPFGVIYSKNLTPEPETGIGRYSDAQIARMLRWSVRPDGKASVQLLMPFANLSDGDLTAIISYLRAQPVGRNPVPKNQFTLIGKVVKSFAPVFKPRTDIARAGADPSIWFVTPNITPAHDSALTKLPDRETFVARFQKGGVHHLGSPMPWEAFGQMSAEDVGALYEYLRSLPAQVGPTGEPTFRKGEAPPKRLASR